MKIFLAEIIQNFFPSHPAHKFRFSNHKTSGYDVEARL